MRIVVGASTFGTAGDDAIKILEEKGVELVKNPFERRLSIEETIEHLQGADGLLAGLEVLNEEVFTHTPNLKAIARIGIGMDNVDIEACRNHGIKVSNTPDAPTEAVAEMALSAILAIAHHIPESNEDMHKKIWKKRLGFSIRDLNVLFVGYGRIGRRFGEHLKYFGANIMVYDPYQPMITIKTLEEGLSQADVITIHASGRDLILSAEIINTIKSGAILLNCARGTLVDEKGVYDALQSGKLSYYWADVYSEEPYNGILLECENALLTPHISTFSKQCRIQMEVEAVNNILNDLEI